MTTFDAAKLSSFEYNKDIFQKATLEDDMEKEFELFIKGKRYVQNVAENTIEFYRVSFRAFNKYAPVKEISDIGKISLLEYVAKMRESGLSAGATNAYIRGTNPFLTWLYENELTKEHFKVKKLKCEKRILKTFTDSQVKAMVNFKPKNVYDKRLHVLILTMLDTGVRINEAFILRWSDVDFENMLMTVTGKGNKQRILPVSIGLRKHLYNYKKTSKTELVFATKDGAKLMYDNMGRNLKVLTDKLGIEGFEGSFHAFRLCLPATSSERRESVYSAKTDGAYHLKTNKRICSARNRRFERRKSKNFRYGTS